MALPKSAINEDRRLEQAVQSSSEALAKHRWHWTTKAVNPKAVSIRQYADAVGRSHQAISQSVRAHELWAADSGKGSLATFGEAQERANMAEQKQIAVDAVADARGMTFGSARRNRGEEIKHVRATAQERAERKGTSVAEEAPRVAAEIVEAEQAAARRRTERKAATPMNLLSVEEGLAKTKRQLEIVLDDARRIDWDDVGPDDDPFVETIRGMLGQIKRLEQLIELAITNQADIDWDAELSSLTGSAG